MRFLLTALLLMVLTHSGHLSAKEDNQVSALLNDDLNRFPNGVTLDSNPDLESLLERADQFIKEKNYKEAIIIFRHLLTQSLSIPCRIPNPASIDRSHPSQIYQPLSRILEDRISQTQELLDIYRSSIDPELESYLSIDNVLKKKDTLKKVMQSHFLSQHGDDATFFLMNVAIDQQQFNNAKGLLDRLYSHPDIIDGSSNLSPQSIALRSYVIHKRLNIESGAKSALAILNQNRSLSPLVRGNIENEMKSASNFIPPVIYSHPLIAKRLINVSSTESDWWLNSWQQPFTTMATLSSPTSQSNSRNVYMNRKDLIKRWRQESWTPVDRPYFHDGRIYYFATGMLPSQQNSERRYHSQHLVCLDMESGKPEWVYTLPKLQQSQNTVRSNNYLVVSNNEPYHPEEIAHFGNLLNHEITFHDTKLFFLASRYEANRRPPRNSSGSTVRGPMGVENNDNLLFSINSDGTKNWQVSPTLPENGDKNKDDKKEVDLNVNRQIRIFRHNMPVQQTCFASGPAIDPDGVYITVAQGNNLYLQKRDTEHGGIAWNTFLCMSNQPINSRLPIKLSISDNEIYVSSGLGLVFKVNKTNGNLIWITRYKRDAEMQKDRYGRNTKYLNYKGWRSNYVYVKSNQVIVLPTDAPRILYIDRANGNIINQTDCGDNSIHPPCNISLGIHGQRLYTAGPGTIISHQWAKDTYSRMQMANLNDNSQRVTGLPYATTDHIFVPKDDQIEIYAHDAMSDEPDTSEMKLIHTIKVETPGQEPLGNLSYQAGHLFSTGAGRLYAIEDSQTLLQKLEMTTDPSPTVFLQKSKIYRHFNRLEEATEALIRSAELAKSTFQDPSLLSKASRKEIVDQLALYSLDDLDKGNALLNLAFEVAQSPLEKQTVLAQRLNLSLKLVDLKRSFALIEDWIKRPPIYYTLVTDDARLEYHFDIALKDILSRNAGINATFNDYMLKKLNQIKAGESQDQISAEQLEKLDLLIAQLKKRKNNLGQQQSEHKKQITDTRKQILELNAQINQMQGDLDQFDQITELQTQRQTLQRQILINEDAIKQLTGELNTLAADLQVKAKEKDTLKVELSSTSSHHEKINILMALLLASSSSQQQKKMIIQTLDLLENLPPNKALNYFPQINHLTDHSKMILASFERQIVRLAAEENGKSISLPALTSHYLKTQEDIPHNQALLKALKQLSGKVSETDITNAQSLNQRMSEKWQFPLQGDRIHILDEDDTAFEHQLNKSLSHTQDVTFYVVSSTMHELVRLDIQSGKPIWRRDVTTPGLLQKANRSLLNHSSRKRTSSHLFTTRHLILLDHGTHLEAIDRLNGKSLWKRKYEKKPNREIERSFSHGGYKNQLMDISENAVVSIARYSSLNNDHGNKHPVIYDSVRLDRISDGSTRWQRMYQKSSPISVHIYKNYVIVKSKNNRFEILDRHSGKLLHTHTTSFNNMPFIPCDAGLIYVDYQNFKLRKWLTNQTQTLGSQIVSRSGISPKAIKMLSPKLCMVVYQEHNNNRNKQMLKARHVNIRTRKMSPIFEMTGQTLIETAYSASNHRLVFITKDNQNYVQAKVFDARNGKTLSFFNLHKDTATEGLADSLSRMDRVPIAGKLQAGEFQDQYRVGIFNVLDPAYHQGFGLDKHYFQHIRRAGVHGNHLLVWTKQAIHAYATKEKARLKTYKVDGFWKGDLAEKEVFSADLKDIGLQLHIAEQKLRLYKQEAIDIRAKSIKSSFEDVMKKVEEQSLKVVQLRKQIAEQKKLNPSK